MLDHLQREIEAIYRLESPHRVADFVVDAETFRRLRPNASAPEELLVLEEEGEVSLAVYVHHKILEGLGAYDPDDPDPALIRQDLSAWAVAVEGVSHFIYLVERVMRGEGASLLELEAQAEVDKFVTALLYCWRRGRKDASPELRRRLFGAVRYRADLDAAGEERYRVANDLARGYARGLESRYLTDGTPDALLRELRSFYRLGAGEKLSRMRAH